MTARLALPERQVTALCRGAAKAGHMAVVEIGNTGSVTVRLIPKADAPDEKLIDTGNDNDLDRELQAFEAKHGDD